MPTTRKKVIKTVYKDEDDSEADAGDFSDSGSEAVISQPSSSDDDEPEIHDTADEENKSKRKYKSKPVKKQRFAKTFIGKVSQQSHSNPSKDESDSDPKEPAFSVKDLTDADKLLPSFLNLSESDSSDEEDTPKPRLNPKPLQTTDTQFKNEESEMETCTEYKDVWSNNLEQSEEIAKQTFLELEKHKSKLEETKLSIQKYTTKKEGTRESDVNDLLALGEDVTPSVSTAKIKKQKGKRKNDSDSEMEDWEEVAEGKTLPQQGLQLIVDFPGTACRKSKTIDVEMMMKRKINRVKKEYQVYMHKVHVLCWLGHGNYVSQVLNDQDVLAAALSLMPSKECYPGERVDMKYVEQITTWFKDKLTVKFDKNEGKFRPKAPPLKNILLQQIQSRAVTSKKYIVFIFVSMLRAVGLQCRIMLNFTTLPIKPPSTELCSLSTKPKANETSNDIKDVKTKETKKKVTKKSIGSKIPQLDGNYDTSSDSDFENIMQVDGNNDASTTKGTRASVKAKSKTENNIVEDVSPPKKPRRNLSIKKTTDLSKSLEINVEDISPPKRPRRNLSIKKATDLSKSFEINDKSNSATANKVNKETEDIKNETVGRKVTRKSLSLNRNMSNIGNKDNIKDYKSEEETNKNSSVKSLSLRKSKISKKDEESKSSKKDKEAGKGHETKLEKKTPPNIIVTDADTSVKISSKYFKNGELSESKRDARARKRSHTSNPTEKPNSETNNIEDKKLRAKSTPGNSVSKSKYFENNKTEENVTNVNKVTVNSRQRKVSDSKEDDSKRVSHKDLMKTKTPTKNDITNDLVKIIKKRVRDTKTENKKGKNSKSSDEDSDYLPEMTKEQTATAAKKAKSKSGGRKIDRRVLSTDDEAPSRKIDVWCEIFVEELEQWIAVDVIKGRAHCVNEIYSGATHPVNYVVGWDNNNYLKDLTRRYVPHWNTITRKQRVEPSWWNTAIQPWVGPRTARDREEDDCLDRMQLDAPLPKSIGEYKNHPLYALKRHLLKFEAIYPPDAATLGFVRGEPVYARDCIYVCRSRDTWLKEAKVVRLGEQPYKVVKARPKWDKLSNKLITDKPLEVFGPWQVQDYEPPTAENGIVPRNAYGNVELFKECMLPKGTAHIKLPGLNRVAKKLNIDCAPAMTGFDFNGGWSHPVYDGFVVCKEFEDIIINAWHEDQEEQERKEQEKVEARVYGNWRRLIKGLLIKERLKLKYGFTEPITSQDSKKKSTGPRLTVKKKC